MKGKVIYVDFTSKGKKAVYSATPMRKGLINRLLESFFNLFKFSEEPRKKQRQESYNYKGMV